MRKLPGAAKPHNAKMCRVVQGGGGENKIKLYRAAALAARKFFGFLRNPIKPIQVFCEADQQTQ